MAPWWDPATTGRADHRTRRAAPEKALDAAVCRTLRQLGFRVTRLQQARASKLTPGIPDLLIFQPVWGLALFVELKAPGKLPSPAQAAWHATARACGYHVATVHTVDELLAALQALGAPILLP